MRTVYCCLLLAGLAYPQLVAGQGTSSFGASETAAIQRLFDGYTKAFQDADYANLREHVQAPFVRFGASNTRAETTAVDWVVLRTVDDTIGFFQNAQDALKALGVEKFEWGQTRITALSADRALVTS